MSKININSVVRRATLAIAAVVLAGGYLSGVVSAAPISNRSVIIGSSVASASTTYNFTFTVGSATTIKSVGFAACTTASGACTPAPGFSASSSTLAGSSNLGSGGSWTVNTATAGELRMANASNTGAPSAGITANFAGVTNPSATNSTFYMRITTYSDAAWTTPIDTGVVATSTAGQVTVTANVDETLTFTLGSTTVPLGTITSSSTGSGTSTMTVGTNAATGYSVKYAGTTLTSAGGTIAALASGGTSSQGTSQFGINLVANTTPSVGSNVSGGGTGAAATGYNTANNFKFLAGDTVASAGAATNNNVFTTSYIANVATNTAAGQYSTAITYTATANF